MHRIREFLDKDYAFAIIGVSVNPDKWGLKIYKKLKFFGFNVYPINPKYKKIDNNICYTDLTSLPKKPDVVITVIPPDITEKIVRECKNLKINKIWMQPGSESKKAITFCKNNDIKVVVNTCFVINDLNKDFGD